MKVVDIIQMPLRQDGVVGEMCRLLIPRNEVKWNLLKVVEIIQMPLRQDGVVGEMYRLLIPHNEVKWNPFYGEKIFQMLVNFDKFARLKKFGVWHFDCAQCDIFGVLEI